MKRCMDWLARETDERLTNLELISLIIAGFAIGALIGVVLAVWG